MIQQISSTYLQSLEKTTGADLLTVYIPLHNGPQGTKHNLSMLHSIYSDLKERLSRDLHDIIVADLKKIEEELDYSGRHQGLAVFASSTATRIYSLFFTPKKLIRIADRFELNPIINQYYDNQPYYVLTISQNGSHLYEADKFSLEEKKVKGLDKSVEEALRIDEVQTNNLQARSVGTGGTQNTQGFHGRGGTKDYRLIHMSKYLHTIDEAVKKTIRNTTVPLVVMAVDYLQSAYKRLSRYPTIYQKAITLNPDHLTEPEIHQMTKKFFFANNLRLEE